MNNLQKRTVILSIASHLKRIANLIAENKEQINNQLIISFNNQSIELFNTLDDINNEDFKSLERLLYQIKYGFPFNSYESAERALVLYNILLNRVDSY